jgi:4-hydroxy-tetrahydrodipicolinate reductase
LKLAVVGATGRMGAAILRLIHGVKDIELVGASDAPNSPFIGLDVGEASRVGSFGVALSADVGSALLGAEVCIDFSTPAAFPAVAKAIARSGVALVCGTTGLNDDATALLDQASQSAPVLWSPNMSVGVQVLAELVQQAVARLGLGYDIEVIETHHRMKADAPSGTALRLVEAAKEARHGLREVTGRQGKPGARKPDEIGVMALRGGDVIGDHSVHLLGDGERLELTHRATNRDLFAHGAIRAARYLVGKKPGRYTMRDVLAQSLMNGVD